MSLLSTSNDPLMPQKLQSTITECLECIMGAINAICNNFVIDIIKAILNMIKMHALRVNFKFCHSFPAPITNLVF